MTDIDFDALNRELEEQAAGRNAPPLPLDFGSFFSAQGDRLFLDSMERAYRAKDIDYYFDLGCGGVKRLAKRLIRKANRFLLFGNFEKQKQLNASLLQANQLLYRKLTLLAGQHEQDARAIRRLEERLAAVEAAR